MPLSPSRAVLDRLSGDRLFGIDLRSLALFRALLALTLICRLLARWPAAGIFLSDRGILTRGSLEATTGAWSLSLHAAGGATGFEIILIGLELLAALFLLAGWRSQLAAGLCFLLEVSLVARNPLVALPADQLTITLLFWSLFLPLGAYWSVDSACADRPGIAAHPRFTGWASAALVIQVLGLYLFSGIDMQSAALPPGQALQQLFAIDGRGSWSGVDALSVDGAQTWGALLATALWILPLVALSPWFSRALRALALLLMVMLQLVVAASLRLGAFPWVTLAGLCVLIDSGFWNAADRRSVARSKGTVTIFYDGHCAACRFGCRLLQAFLILPDLQLRPAQDDRRAHALMQANDSWVVIDGDGSAALHWAAFALLLRRSPLFAPLGWLVGREIFSSAGNGVYRWTARNRALLSRIGSALPSPRPPMAASPALQRLAGVLLGVILIWNLLALADPPPHSAVALQRPLQVLGLDSQWSLLDPERLDTAVVDGRWRVLAGHFADGSEIDLLDTAHDRVRFVRPIAAEQLPPRWRHFIVALPAQPAAVGDDFGRYLCRRWNANSAITVSTNGRLQSIQLLALRADPQAGQAGSPRAPAEQEVVWRHDCTIGAATY